MSLLEVMGTGVLTFSFTLQSCFVGITSQMMLIYSSLSFFIASSLIFCALIRWILHLWLGVRPRGLQRGAGAVPGEVVLNDRFWPGAAETGWANLENQTI
jgi:hypothetical protein